MPGYAGQTYRINTEKSGLSHNKNIDAIPPNSFIYPSRNITLHEGGIRKRGGTAHLDDEVMAGVGSVSFTGDGNNDLTVSGSFTGSEELSYKIEIDGIGYNNFSSIFSTNKYWSGVAVNALTKDVYVCSNEASGTVYFDEDGDRTFSNLGLTGRSYEGVCVNLTNNNAWLCVYEGDIYKWTDASGTWTAQSATNRKYTSCTVNVVTDDVYITVQDGSIYKQTSGTGALSEYESTARKWTGIDINPFNSDIYACVDEGDIYKQTAGTGNFTALSAGNKRWKGVAVDYQTGNVYAVVWNGGLWCQYGGSGDFVEIESTARYWEDIDIDYLSGEIYGVVWQGEVYIRDPVNSGSFNSLGQSGKTWLCIDVDHSTGDVWANAHLDGVYKQTGGSGPFVKQDIDLYDYRDIAIDPITGCLYLAAFNYGILMHDPSDNSLSIIDGRDYQWEGIGVNYISKDLYATVLGGKIYKGTAGDIKELEVESDDERNWVCISCDSFTNNVYTVVNGGDIYKQTAGTGSFTALSAGNRAWIGVDIDPYTFDVWATVETDLNTPAAGDIYKQTAGTGSFVAQNQGDKHWIGIAVDDSSGHVYAVDGGDGHGQDPVTINNGDLYKYYPINPVRELTQIVKLPAISSYEWQDVAINKSTGTIYAIVKGGSVYKKAINDLTFYTHWSTSKNFEGIAVNSNTGDIWVIVRYGEVYKQTAGTGDFAKVKSSDSYTWLDIAVNSSTGDVWATASGIDIYKNTGGSGSFVAQSAGAKTWTSIEVNPDTGDVWACVYNEYIYKNTAGTGSFVAVTSDAGKTYKGITVDNILGNVYSTVTSAYGTEYIYMLSPGGDFSGIINIEPKKWAGIDIDPASNKLYIAENSKTEEKGGIYELPLTPTDSFKWSSTGGESWDAQYIQINGLSQSINNGLTLTFDNTYNHALGDYWTFDVTVREITGLYDFRMANGTQWIVRGDSDGSLWKDSSNSIKTGLSTDQYYHFSQWGDTLFICNGSDIPQTWDGSSSSTSDLGDPAADWTTDSYPTQMIAHGRGNSSRNWALGCAATPNYVYASEDGDPDDFINNSLAFYIETGDGSGLTGGAEFGDRLFLFSKTKCFILDDDDTNTDNWGYYTAQWFGGAAHHRLVVRTPNDLICMMDDGEIYSVSSAMEYGDYRAASIIRPSYIHEYINDYINLSAINTFHAVYDMNLRAVLFFVASTGNTTPNMALVFFIDTKNWSVLNNLSYASGYSALCSARVLQSAGIWKIYTGDNSGVVWKLNETNRSDNNNSYYAGILTPHLSMENPRVHKRFDNVRLVSTDQSYNMQVRWRVDGVTQEPMAITSSTNGTKLNTFMLNEDYLVSPTIGDDFGKLGQFGKRLQLEVYNNKVNEDFLLSQILIDFIITGAKS